MTLKNPIKVLVRFFLLTLLSLSVQANTKLIISNNFSLKLSTLTPGQDHKFIYSKTHKTMVIALPGDKSLNHKQLAEGFEINDQLGSAGYITVFKKKNSLHIALTNKSKHFCPSVLSLQDLTDNHPSIKIYWYLFEDTSPKCTNNSKNPFTKTFENTLFTFIGAFDTVWVSAPEEEEELHLILKNTSLEDYDKAHMLKTHQEKSEAFRKCILIDKPFHIPGLENYIVNHIEKRFTPLYDLYKVTGEQLLRVNYRISGSSKCALLFKPKTSEQAKIFQTYITN